MSALSNFKNSMMIALGLAAASCQPESVKPGTEPTGPVTKVTTLQSIGTDIDGFTVDADSTFTVKAGDTANRRSVTYSMKKNAIGQKVKIQVLNGSIKEFRGSINNTLLAQFNDFENITMKTASAEQNKPVAKSEDGLTNTLLIEDKKAYQEAIFTNFKSQTEAKKFWEDNILNSNNFWTVTNIEKFNYNNKKWTFN